MKINGVNRLACQTLFKTMPETVAIEPLPGFRIIKDLVVDLTPFFQKIETVLPYLINRDPCPETERIQSAQEHKKILECITCILCGCCTSSCPVFWANQDYTGPAALLKAYRFIFDSRDQASKERIEAISHSNGVWRCRDIFNCTEVCPKEIKITKHLVQLKQTALKNG
jgi:succinate dehydrogenase / fumarate reductase iron-sulfur subunit